MAEENTFYGKPRKSKFFFREPNSDRVVMIQAETQSEADKKFDEMDKSKATYVAKGPDGKPLVRTKQRFDNGGIDADVVLESVEGQRFLVGDGLSTSDPDAINRFIEEGITTENLISESTAQSIIAENPVDARAAAARQSSLFGLGSFADEALQKLFGGNIKMANDAYVKAMNSENPLETFLLQAGVSTLEAGTVLKMFPQLAQLFGRKEGSSRIANSVRAGVAGATGAGIPAGIQAAGEADDGFRISEGAKGGAIGAATGGVLGTATPFIGEGFNRVAEVIKKSEIGQIAAQLGISRSAAMVIKSAIVQGGDLQQAIANIRSAGENGMLADAGVAAQALADAASASGPQAAETISTNVSNRANKVIGNLDRTLTEELGNQTLGPKSALKIIRDRQGAQRLDAYNLAYETPIDYASSAGIALEQVLDTIDPSIMQQAIKKANISMRADNIKNMQVKASIADDGEITFTNPPNVIQLDYIKKSLGSLAEDSKGEFGKITDDSRIYSKLYRRLRNAMNDAITDVNGNRVYEIATQYGGDVLQEEAAFKLGRDLLNPKTNLEDVLETLGTDPSVAQLAAIRMGLQQFIRKSLDDVKVLPSDPDMAARQLDQFMRITGSNNATNKIKAIMGNQADALLNQIKEVQTSAVTRANTRGNSRTIIRASTNEMVENLTQGGPAQTLLEVKPAAAAQQIGQELTGFTKEFTEERKQAIFNDIATALTRIGTDDAVDVLRIIDRVQRGLEVSNADRQFASNRLAFYLQGVNQKTTEQQVSEAVGREAETGLPRYGVGLLVP